MSVEEITDPAELIIAAEIVRRLETIPAMVDRHERLTEANSQPRSQMQSDDDATAWMQMSHTVNHCLSMAMDNLHALNRLLLSDGQLMLHQFAHYPMLRSALEAASRGYWILIPEDKQTRVQRLLQTRAREARYDSEMFEEMLDYGRAAGTFPDEKVRSDEAKLAARNKRLTDKIAGLAEQNDVGAVGRLPGYAEIIRQANNIAGIPGEAAAAVWSMISGLSHPSTLRAVNFSTLQEQFESVNGVVHTKLTSDVEWVHLALMASLSAYSRAEDLLRHRMLVPATE